MNRFFRSAFFPLLVIVLLVWLASQTLIPKGSSSAKLTTSQALADVKANEVEQAVFNPNKRSIELKLDTGKSATVHYASDYAQFQFQNALSAHQVVWDSKGTGGFSWTALIGSFLPFLLLIGFWIFLMNQVQGGGSKVMSFGKSRAKRMAPDSPKIGFKDVAGVDE
ncbi:MAG TPA: ATP-dependent metallopeptidase FtsH/Yme1/Tma family protein, partial [Gaiellaceae bacterium]|nr:ATP-dependent metallopeptidase FtsH/Yme1/Tma family protein [Gaiellaceae bacterium]